MGSSSGPAVGVSAGYAPISIGTETDGSLVLPANRAALYTLKPTIPIISREGIVPITSFCDSAGPMTKSVEDLAVLMDVLVDRSKTCVPAGGYISAVTATWEGLKIGTLDPEVWTFSEVVRQREPGAEEQMVSADIPRHHQALLIIRRGPKQEKHMRSSESLPPTFVETYLLSRNRPLTSTEKIASCKYMVGHEFDPTSTGI